MLLVGLMWSLHAQPPRVPLLSYQAPDSVASLMAGYPLNNLPLLSRKLTSPFSRQRDQFRAIYKWVCENIEGDVRLFQTNRKKRLQWINDPVALAGWNRQIGPQTWRNLVTQRKTICTGYAALIRELCTQAGIRCVVVDGYGRNRISNIGGTGTPNHSWNAVMLDGQWYLCDATWSAGSVNPELGSYERHFEEAYFLPEPLLFASNHYPIDTAWLLMRSKPTLTDFLEAPLIYSAALDFQVESLTPAKFRPSVRPRQAVACSLVSRKAAAVIIWTVDGEPAQTGGDHFQTSFRWPGGHTITAYFDGRPVVSWEVRVGVCVSK